MKKLITGIMIAAMTAAVLTGCGDKAPTETTDTDSTASIENKDKDIRTSKASNISVVSREDGSGTRGAFIELFGIEEKDDAGNKTDHTTDEAVIANSTEIVLSNVAGDPNAIGYVSLGSLSDSVSALKIDGVEAAVANIKDGTYKISRPFNIATAGTPSELTQDFINYIISKDGQKIVEDAGYITSIENAAAFTANGATGKVVVAGSSSVTPVMEKLKEAYEKVNKDAEIEIQSSDSTTGLQAAIGKTADIGMASRELKDSESALTPTVIAIDGIAVIVNKENKTTEMTADEVKSIFTGEVTSW